MEQLTQEKFNEMLAEAFRSKVFQIGVEPILRFEHGCELKVKIEVHVALCPNDADECEILYLDAMSDTCDISS